MLRCFHPIVTPSGTFNCGKCDYCRNLKSYNLSELCEMEASACKYTYFVTLTYDEDNLPLLKVVNDTPVPYRCSSQRLVSLCTRLRDGDVHDNILCELHNNDCVSIPANLPDKVNRYSCIPYLDKLDLQLFFKRLRKNLDNYGIKNVRYYACGEYGPVHFRPHYHLLLYTNQTYYTPVVSRCIRKAWTLGRVDCQLTSGKACRYVSNYLNGGAVLPDLYNVKAIRPFYIHSTHFGHSSFQEAFVKKSERNYDPRSACELLLGQGLSGCLSIPATRSYIDTLYPKCPAMSSLSLSELNGVARVYDACIRETGITSVTNQVIYLQQTYTDSAVYNLITHYYPIYRDKDINDSYISSILYFGKSIHKIASRLGLSFEDCVFNTYEFWRLASLRRLSRFYQSQCDFVDNYNIPDKLLYLSSWYSNIGTSGYIDPSLNPCERSYSYYERFYESLGYTPYFVDRSLFRRSFNPLYRDIVAKHTKLSRDRVKHKTLNDANRLLFNI